MNLLTEPQIAEASAEDLDDTWKALNRRMDQIDERAALDTARQTLAEHGITDPLQLTFDVEEWENGYFYSPIVAEVRHAGHEVDLPQVVLDALEEALDEALRGFGHNGPTLGRGYHTTIDLASDTIIRGGEAAPRVHLRGGPRRVGFVN